MIEKRVKGIELEYGFSVQMVPGADLVVPSPEILKDMKSYLGLPTISDMTPLGKFAPDCGHPEFSGNEEELLEVLMARQIGADRRLVKVAEAMKLDRFFTTTCLSGVHRITKVITMADTLTSKLYANTSIYRKLKVCMLANLKC